MPQWGNLHFVFLIMFVSSSVFPPVAGRQNLAVFVALLAAGTLVFLMRHCG